MNLSELKKLIRLFENSEITDLELEQDGARVRMKKRKVVQVSSVSNHEPVAKKIEQPQPKPKEAEPASTGYVIKAPMVGSFYRSSTPTNPPFVEEGDLVRKGQVLCIIEAMKLMNEIESDANGKIVKIFSENGKPVEFGEPLFEISVS